MNEFRTRLRCSFLDNSALTAAIPDGTKEIRIIANCMCKELADCFRKYTMD